MGNRYYASVTFPAAAKEIPELAKTMKAYEIEETDETVKVIDHEANYGAMDEITDILEEHMVPYDHEESPSSSDEVNQTHHIRWPAGAARVADILVAGKAERIVTTLQDSDYATAQMASSWLKMLDAGNLGELRRCIELTAKEVDVGALVWKAPT
jgi:hypothetical protein